MPDLPIPAAPSPARRLAFAALKEIYQGGFADVVLHRHLQRTTISGPDRPFATELVYGIVRRQRTLDALIDQLGTKKAQQQPLELRIVLHLGLYQLRYLSHVPPSAAVNTSVDLVKAIGLPRLSGVVNGILRQYLRLQGEGTDPLLLPTDAIAALGIRHSFPDWLVALWLEAIGPEATDALCDWLNQSPTIDLRVHSLRATVDTVEAAFTTAGIATTRLPGLPWALRLVGHSGSIREMPGYDNGWWTVQDASAQWVSYLVDPQPDQVVIDACAAPGGKAAHLAALMEDTGTIWACDRTPSRLKKIQQTCDRLGLKSIHTLVGDSTTLTRFEGQGDRVIVDAPCSGLGTLHRHADARWRQTPETIQELVQLQQNLLDRAATWVKPGGTLVYATCTLHPAENEAQVNRFLQTHPDWHILPPAPESSLAASTQPEGWVKIWPHEQGMDGFFMARMGRA
ncbi:16S rRNA (cytosine(967)-C(5))-methyltransferase [Leptolyngbya sp. PCC 6406]|uniref:16S rRNA (cytosine(967)-C(5))-methyltransferase n=1 Tax=Leptolyngbya sp. PCC 6406 TaxID=1173264 RepID=UPI0002ABAE8A|nr:16S rRNA (cytosine(967)-C(5))-methyltransferase [Leptolyngbya sp. PCC 6406]